MQGKDVPYSFLIMYCSPSPMELMPTTYAVDGKHQSC